MDTIKISMGDLIMRYSLYISAFGQGSGGAPEVHYQFAIGALGFLESKGVGVNERTLSRLIGDLDRRVDTMDAHLHANSDYSEQVGEFTENCPVMRRARRTNP